MGVTFIENACLKFGVKNGTQGFHISYSNRATYSDPNLSPALPIVILSLMFRDRLLEMVDQR